MTMYTNFFKNMSRCGAIVPQRGIVSRARVHPPPRHGHTRLLPYL
jgi:hypothetical protein